MEKITQLKKGPLARAYIIHGPDKYGQEQAYQALYQRALEEGFEDWNWVTVSGDKDLELSQLIRELTTSPWGGGVRIVVVNNAERLPTEFMNQLVKWLEKNTQANCLALFFDKLDKRLKSTKELLTLGMEVFCPSLAGDKLIRWVQDYLTLRQKSISREATAVFLERVGSDLNLITNELEKLLLYADSESTINEKHVREITSLVPGQLEQGAIFNMVEAISAKDQKLALEIFHQLIDAGEVPLRILPLIERQLRLLLAAKTKATLNTATVAKAMGESSDFALKKALRYQQNFSLEQLYQGFAEIVKVDGDLKYGANPEQIMEQLIITLCA